MDAASSKQLPRPELPIPRTATHAIGLGLVWLFALASVSVAVFNLSRPAATPLLSLAASALWLAFAAVVIAVGCSEAGSLRQFVINCVGAFAIEQLAWIEGDLEGPRIVCFGYRLGPWQGCYVKIQLNAISQVRWNTGQGTALAGRDVHDWSVVVRFDKRKSSVTPAGRQYPDRIYIVGPTGPKELTEEFGLELVKFLCDSGARLVRTKEEHTFRRTPFVDVG